MTARILASVALGLLVPAMPFVGGCSLLFPFDTSAVPSDAAPASATDAGPDAGSLDAGPCPDRPLEDRTYADCLGCGAPCGPHRPFCCGDTCCAEECGTQQNQCSRVPEPIQSFDAGPEMDAGHPEWPDGGCDPYLTESCLGCDRPCDARHPFCCGAICCSEECGSLAGDCSTGP